MIQSMTGYAKAEVFYNNSTYLIELKSLNSKQLDLKINIPAAYRYKEIEIKKLIAKELHRGKIDLFVSKKSIDSKPVYQINNEVVASYYNQMIELTSKLDKTSNQKKDTGSIISSLLKIPDVIVKKNEEISNEELNTLLSGIKEVIKKTLVSRSNEGKELLKDMVSRINLISKLLIHVKELSETMASKIEEKIKSKINSNFNLILDQNRFEQEMIYYLEKLDMTEEVVRLKSHIKYFEEVTKERSPVGKKLNFISQEIGREINTIGSKCSNADIQKIVVEMKNELEKIKEQLLNIL